MSRMLPAARGKSWPITEWHRTFFDKLANDFWEAAVPQDRTDREVDFLVDVMSLDRASHVLDVAAGRGRLALPLASRVGRVVALDFSTDAVESLRAAARRHVDVVRADMRALPLTVELDGCYCMGNSFGYFDIDGVVRFLAEVSRVLRPAGRFVVESASVEESLLADLAGSTSHTFGGVTVRGRHELQRGRLVSTLEFDDGAHRTTRTVEQLVLGSARIAALVRAAGLSVIEMLGSTAREPYTARAPSLLVVAEKD